MNGYKFTTSKNSKIKKIKNKKIKIKRQSRLADNFHPLADPVFKRWMKDEYICSEFLNALLGEEIEIQEIHSQYEIGGGQVKARGLILDILAKDQKFEIYNIESQVRHKYDHVDRTIFHGCRLISNQLKQGDEFENIKKTTVIFINLKNSIGIDLIDSASFRDDKQPHNVYSHKVRIININLNKLDDFILQKLQPSELKLQFFVTFLLLGYNELAFEKIYEDYKFHFPELKNAIKKQFDFMKNDAQLCNDVDKYFKENGPIKEDLPMLLANKLLEQGERKGRLEGKLEGRLEGEIRGRIAMAFNLIDMGMALNNLDKLTDIDALTLRELYERRNDMTLDEIVQHYIKEKYNKPVE